MKKCINGKMIEITPEEIAQRQAKREAAERAEWLSISYGEAVDREFRKKYLQRDVEAIINNYLADPNNAKYVREFQEMQAYREQCKAYVKQMFAKYGRTVTPNESV